MLNDNSIWLIVIGIGGVISTLLGAVAILINYSAARMIKIESRLTELEQKSITGRENSDEHKKSLNFIRDNCSINQKIISEINQKALHFEKDINLIAEKMNMLFDKISSFTLTLNNLESKYKHINKRNGDTKKYLIDINSKVNNQESRIHTLERLINDN